MRSDTGRFVERDSPLSPGAELPTLRKFKVRSLTAWAHHRSGWGPCTQVLQDLACPNGGVLLVDSVERLIRDSIVLDEPWVGFVHKAVLAPEHREAVYGAKRDASLPAMMATDVWQRNIDRCRGLFCLSEHLRAYVQPRVPCPVEAVAHPTSFDCEQFDFESFDRNEDKSVLMVGHWLRRFQSFHDLQAPGFRKRVLKCQDEQLYDRLHSVLRDNGSVEWLPWQPKAAYDRLLSQERRVSRPDRRQRQQLRDRMPGAQHAAAGEPSPRRDRVSRTGLPALLRRPGPRRPPAQRRRSSPRT